MTVANSFENLFNAKYNKLNYANFKSEMKRIYHLLIIIIPPILIGLFARDEKQMIQLMMWHIGVVIPIATILRMRYFGLNKKQIWKSFFPFLGFKNRFIIYFKEKQKIDSDK